MMSDDSTTRVVSDSGNDIGPGQRLREAREAAKLTSAEVASRMRLEPYILEMLENDDYEQLHGPTFVRGYLSGYARLLNLPERPILEAYERHGFGPPALVSELGGKAEVHVSDFPVRMTTYIIAGLLVVLVVMWWQSRQAPTAPAEMARGLNDDTGAGNPPPATASTGSDDEPASPASTTTSAPVATASPGQSDGAADAPETPDTASPAVEPAATSEATPVQPQMAAMEEAAVPDAGGGSAAADPSVVIVTVDEPPPDASTGGADATIASAAPPAETVPAENQSNSEPDQAAAVIEVAGADAENTAEEEAAPPRPDPLPGSDVLAIQLQRESWIEIYDRGGGRLYYSLAREGSEIVVQGAGPMEVLLGDVEGAAVVYNGEPFDLSRYQGRSVVRFTIGELSSTTPETPTPSSEELPAPGAPEPTARERQRERTAAVAPESLEAPSPAIGSPEAVILPANAPAVLPDS